MAKKKTVVEETPKVEENVIEATEVNVDVDALSKSIESVDTTLPSNEEAIKEIEEKVSEMLEGQEAFNDAIAQNPENAEAIINNELKKAEVLKSEVEKIIKTTDAKPKKKIISNMTNWWNGMGYDF